MSFSIIVPIFNVEAYLEDCLNSIINQSFRNFEVIAINDGSTDNSLVIAERMASKDSRIKLYTQNNQGLSKTRNNGIELAKGDFIIFLDSDDKLSVDALSLIYKEIKDHSLDMLIYSAACFGELSEDDSNSKYKRHSDLINTTMTQKKFFVLSNTLNSFFPSSCLYAIKRTLSISIKFYPNIYHEDNLYTTQLFLLKNNKRVRAINNAIYQRRVRPGSITQSTTMKHAEGYETVLMELLKLHPKIKNNNNKQYDQSFIKAYNINLIRVFRGLLSSTLLANKKSIPLKLKVRYIKLIFSYPKILINLQILSLLFISPSAYQIIKYYYKKNDNK